MTLKLRELKNGTDLRERFLCYFSSAPVVNNEQELLMAKLTSWLPYLSFNGAFPKLLFKRMKGFYVTTKKSVPLRGNWQQFCIIRTCSIRKPSTSLTSSLLTARGGGYLTAETNMHQFSTALQDRLQILKHIDGLSDTCAGKPWQCHDGRYE